jgi:hypothetical protein
VWIRRVGPSIAAGKTEDEPQTTGRTGEPSAATAGPTSPDTVGRNRFADTAGLSVRHRASTAGRRSCVSVRQDEPVRVRTRLGRSSRGADRERRYTREPHLHRPRPQTAPATRQPADSLRSDYRTAALASLPLARESRADRSHRTEREPERDGVEQDGRSGGRGRCGRGTPAVVLRASEASGSLSCGSFTRSGGRSADDASARAPDEVKGCAWKGSA